jgi:putative transcriptional regulator
MTEALEETESGITIHLDILLVQRKMTLTQLAADVGMHINALSRLKNGDVSFIRIETLRKLCKALDCQPGDLLVYTDHP